MRPNTTTLLCTGDIHIGRRPTRLPRTADSPRHAAKHAWHRTVDQAINQRVDALVLTGDIIDRENRYYEALGPLLQGLERLDAEGIETFAVAGNHDFDVFPEIVESLEVDRFHLLGPQGSWTREPLRLEGETEPRLFLDGFSFPQQHISYSPLDSYEYEAVDAPVLGVLHADVDPGQGARYAPVRSRELARAGPDLWLLGHIHKPQLKETDTGVPYLYPGSPQPLDPGEQGTHGPYLIEVDASGEIQAEQLATATVRYEELTVDVDGVEQETEVRSRLHERVREALRGGLEDLGPVEQLVCRLTLDGRTSLQGSLLEIAGGATDDLELTIDGTMATVETISNEARPALDLDELAEENTPPGALARIVQALDEGKETEETKAVLQAAKAKVREVDRSSTYAPVFDHDEELAPVDRVDLEKLVQQQALLLIDALERDKRGDAS